MSKKNGGPQNVRSPLALRMISYILLAGLLFIIVNTGWLIRRDYRQATNALYHRIDSLEGSTLITLTESVFHINEVMMMLQIEGILMIDGVEYIELREIRGDEILVHHAGIKTENSFPVRTFPLNYDEGDGAFLRLGELDIYVDDRFVSTYVRQRSADILIANFLLLLLFIGSLAILMYRLVRRPLQKIVDFSDALSLDQLDHEIKVYPKSGRFFRPDEFDHLQDTLNNMRRRLADNIAERTAGQEEREKLEQQYLQAQKMESIGRLAGGVAHDLNNLLTPIIGFSEMILDDMEEDDPHSGGLGQVLKAGHKAAELVSQLLAFSRQKKIVTESVDLNSVIRNFENLLKGSLRDDIVLKTELDESLECIDGIPGHVEQILMNLAVNAQDAMPGGGELRIRTTMSAQKDGNYAAVLQVRDKGTGMDEKTRELIFEPFFTTKGEKGTGLGLATVYGLVQQHGGRIDLDSAEGAGSEFSLFFPLSKKAAVRNGKKVMSQVNRAINGKILLVDDDEGVLGLTEMVLMEMGFAVDAFLDSYEVLRKLEQPDGDEYDLMVIDVVMPGMNGVELYERARAIVPDIKALFISGYADDVIDRSSLRETAFLDKPFTIDQLRSKVDEII